MKLVLHIGTEKTGTTSIQRYLNRNSGALQEKGFFYSKSLGRPNNIDIAVYGMDLDPEDPFFLQRAIFDVDDHAAFRTKLQRDLAAEVAAARDAGCHAFVISNEHCHSRLTRADQVAPVHALLSRVFDHVEILCYIRPQVELAISLASTVARMERVTADYFEHIDAADPYYDYHALLARWTGFFGRDAMTVVPFKSVENPAADFARRLGVSNWQEIANDRINASLDVHTIAMLNAIGAQAYILPGQITRHPVPFVEDLPVIEKIKLPLVLAQRIQSQFSDVNRQLIDEWPSITSEDIEPDWSRFDHDGNLDKLLLPSPLGDYLKPLVAGFNRRSWLDGAQLNLAFSERAEARGKLQNALAFLAQARAFTGLVRQTFGTSEPLEKIEQYIEKLGERVEKNLASRR